MWSTRAGLLALLLAAFCGTKAQADPFSRWEVSGYAQALGLHRPSGMTASGPLDSDSHEATGLARDGLFLRRLEFKLHGPLGPPYWSLTLGSQTDLVSAGLSDALVQRDAADKTWAIKAGQQRLPFGQEQQSSSSKLLGIQRSLSTGFGNYGHVDNWGLGILAERGLGLRADHRTKWGEWARLDLQLGAFQARGQSFNAAPAGLGRAGIRLGSAAWGLELGTSGHASRANLSVTSSQYTALGAPSASPREQGPGIGGRNTVLTWGQDAGLDLGFLHGRGELHWQSLDALTRSGARASVWLESPLSWETRSPYLYATADQASSSFADGVHRPGSLYKALSLGAGLPLPGPSHLKVEHLKLSCDDFPAGFASDQVVQGQWQLDF